MIFERLQKRIEPQLCNTDFLAEMPKRENSVFLKEFFTHQFCKKELPYSDRSATTGSFFEALLEGIKPDSSVSPILMSIRMIAAGTGRTAFRL